MPRHGTPHPDLAGYVLGILEPAEAARFGDHVAECSACRAEVAELSALPDLLTRGDLSVEPPAALRARTLSAVDAAPARGASSGPRARRTVALATLAAVVMLVLALAAGALLSRSRDGTDGEGFVAELSAVSTASPAGGTAHLQQTSQGVVVELDVWGLPAEAGAHYECWYVEKGEGGGRVSAGTFVTDAEGNASVQMITAADPLQFPRIVVTREAPDGNPAPGEPVLVSS